MIKELFWPVPPGDSRPSRPRQLCDVLRVEGVIDPLTVVHHGRAGSTPESNHFSDLDASELKPDERMVFSPLFPGEWMQGAAWVDLYDDWSIAPDIHPVRRLRAARNYKLIAARRLQPVLVTVNTPYMAAKLRIARRFVVANGVSAEHGFSRRGGDSSRRLIVMGNFFRGRTDYDALRRVVRTGVFSELIVGAPGGDKTVLAICAEARETGMHVQVREWLTAASISELAGRRTAALIPHVVSDYTLSQDLMKAYLFQALGVRVICPLQLWPTVLPKDQAYLYGPGSLSDSWLSDWLELGQPSDKWRADFVRAHSWEARANQIECLLNGAGQ